MKHESLEKFLADARLYLGLEEGQRSFAEGGPEQYPTLSGSAPAGQWTLGESGDQPARSPE